MRHDDADNLRLREPSVKVCPLSRQRAASCVSMHPARRRPSELFPN